MYAKKLTFIIPTCNRPDTLKYTLETIVLQKNPEVEIIVSDNYSDPPAKHVVDLCNDLRVKLIRTDRRLGMSEHWDFAISHAQGEWISIIGDDDGMLLDGVERFFELINKYNVNAISSSRCNYSWPGVSGSNSKLMIPSNGTEEIRDSQTWMEKVLTTSGDWLDLPCIYTGGFVKRSVMEQIRNKTGRCFLSISPDVFSGFAIASLESKYLYSNRPLAIAGTSSHSIGLKVSRTPRKDAAQIDFFIDNALKFHPLLGDGSIRSHQLYMYEAYLQCEQIRNFDVRTTLEEQLILAMIKARKSQFREVREGCRGLAVLNNLNFNQMLRRVNRERIKSYGRKKINIFFDFFKPKLRNSVHITSVNMPNVLEAAKEIARLNPFK